MKEYGYKKTFEYEPGWEDAVKYVVDVVLKEDEDEIKDPIYSMIVNRYFVTESSMGYLFLSKFIDEIGELDFILLEISTRIATRFLDKMIDIINYGNISHLVLAGRPIGISLIETNNYPDIEAVIDFVENVMIDESITIGEEKGIPDFCKDLDIPRRNLQILVRELSESKIFDSE